MDNALSQSIIEIQYIIHSFGERSYTKRFLRATPIVNGLPGIRYRYEVIREYLEVGESEPKTHLEQSFDNFQDCVWFLSERLFKSPINVTGVIDTGNF